MSTHDGAVGRDDQIVVRLTKATSPDVADLSELSSPLATFLKAHHLTSHRDIQSVTARQLLEWEAEARGHPFAPRHSLTTYWLLDARHATQPMKLLLAGLRKLAGVAEAYQQPRWQPAIATPVNDPVYGAGGQGYLGPAQQGIDVEWAWRLQPSRDGTGARFIDVELGWQAGHEDVGPLPTLSGGVNRQGTSNAFHGLAVLGIVQALTNNGLGIAGAAPGAAAVQIVSARYADPAHPADPLQDPVNVADALAAAHLVASPGDIVLVELQTPLFAPVESVSAEQTAIMLLVSNGVVVVEAAGDAHVELATYPAVVAVDSGAIVVAGAHSALPHTWDGVSNWGARVDAYAWGENVYTTGGIGTAPPAPPPPIAQDAPNRYTIDFNASSSAAAIVAGAALLVQGAYASSSLGARTPGELRDLFRTTGTPAGVPASGIPRPIGHMPDLKQLLPDIYIRDNLTDDGTVPTAGALSTSPDVIVTTAMAANPQATYGAGSPNENVDTLGELVVSGQTNYVYVRMKNRGTGIARGCTAKVYWSTPSTLVLPPWTQIGTTAAVDVGPALTVTDALVWDPVPATGHYCFVAIAHHPLDPAPTPPVGSWTQFVDFIRDNNNVTWRNFNVVDLLSKAPAHFTIKGAPDAQRVFDLEILRERADKLEIEFEVPLALSRRLTAASLPKPVIDKGQQLATYRLPRDRVLKIPGVVLPAEAVFPCRFVVDGVAPATGPLPTVAVSQIFEHVEVGRVTWAYRASR